MNKSELEKLLIELKLKLETIERSYVSKHEFLPIKTFVYGVVSVSMLGVLGGILKLVFGS